MPSRIIVLLTLLLSSLGYAQEVDSRVTEIDGKTFVCFDEEFSRNLLQIRINYPKLTLKIEKLEELISVKEQQLTKYATAEVQLQEQIKFLSKENANLNLQISQNGAWYKSPYLWFSFGLLVATATTITVYETVRK